MWLSLDLTARRRTSELPPSSASPPTPPSGPLNDARAADDCVGRDASSNPPRFFEGGCADPFVSGGDSDIVEFDIK
ncbi:hypothetical protein GWI33_004901 [Rhynchophorus ferrugineus]|uniref:Uncharacterized protein n=1 Tax=Rhynchophorus ferrugineus TaxID=354439 RepID=A0A834MID7_RHYFE|nr:hypothetical protein GWI33_004901 [Rhynchophorus ferrugineus]